LNVQCCPRSVRDFLAFAAKGQTVRPFPLPGHECSDSGCEEAGLRGIEVNLVTSPTDEGYGEYRLEDSGRNGYDETVCRHVAARSSSGQCTSRQPARYQLVVDNPCPIEGGRHVWVLTFDMPVVAALHWWNQQGSGYSQ